MARTAFRSVCPAATATGSVLPLSRTIASAATPVTEVIRWCHRAVILLVDARVRHVQAPQRRPHGGVHTARAADVILRILGIRGVLGDEGGDGRRVHSAAPPVWKGRQPGW